MSKKRNYYKVLGIDKSASLQGVKQAYRRLAKKYHPDVSTEKDAQAKFKEVNEAYQILSNPKARQQYDQFNTSTRKKSKKYNAQAHEQSDQSEVSVNWFKVTFLAIYYLIKISSKLIIFGIGCYFLVKLLISLLKN